VRIKSAYKVRRALINKGIIGVSVRSLFYDPDNQVVMKKGLLVKEAMITIRGNTVI